LNRDLQANLSEAYLTPRRASNWRVNEILPDLPSKGDHPQWRGFFVSRPERVNEESRMANRVSLTPPAIWQRYLQELKQKLTQIEAELKSAQGEEALKLRAHFDKIRQDINYLTA
jgi:hypothetical protein